MHYLVGDATGNASVVFWDKLARELLHKTAPELKAVLARVLALYIIGYCYFCLNLVLI